MPDTSPTPVDLDIAQRLRQIALQALDLVAELRSTRASIGPDSERTDCPACSGAMPAHHMGQPLQAEHAKHTAGPDSERIRELEAENERLRKAYDQRIGELSELGLENARLRAAGLLPGPDDIVVSREALETMLSMPPPLFRSACNCPRCQAYRVLRAALSQPHPAQEQQ